MFLKGKYNTDISRNAQYLALFQSPSDRKQIGIIERMFDKNRVHLLNAYYKETEKPFGYLLVDNKPNTPADKQVLTELFGECYVYHFAVNGLSPHQSQKLNLQENCKPLPSRMSRSMRGKNTHWEHRRSVRLPKDMLSHRLMKGISPSVEVC